MSKPKLTAEQYDQLIAAARKYSPMRLGQYIMNTLGDISVDVHRAILTTNADPYSNDQNLALFWLTLEREYVDKRAIPANTDDDTSVLVVGNLTEGFRMVGPFEDFQAAAEYSESIDTDSWVTTLMSPEEFANRLNVG